MVESRNCNALLRSRESCLAHIETGDQVHCPMCPVRIESLCDLEIHTRPEHIQNPETRDLNTSRGAHSGGGSAGYFPFRNLAIPTTTRQPTRTEFEVVNPYAYESNLERVDEVIQGAWVSGDLNISAISSIKPGGIPGQGLEEAGTNLMDILGPDEDFNKIHRTIEEFSSTVKECRQLKRHSLDKILVQKVEPRDCELVSSKSANKTEAFSSGIPGGIDNAPKLSEVSLANLNFAESEEAPCGGARIETDRMALDTIICFECGSNFATLPDLQLHQTAQDHGYCKLCSAFFADREALEKHTQLVHNFRCPICPLIFNTWEKIIQHQRDLAHGFCRECNCLFLDRKSQEKHRRSAHSAVYCATCGKGFDTELGMKQHKRSANHCYCGPCDEVFWDEPSMWEHATSGHHHKCTAAACDFATSKLEKLQKHQRDKCHNYCAQCNRVFHQPDGMRSHMWAKHRDEKSKA